LAESIPDCFGCAVAVAAIADCDLMAEATIRIAAVARAMHDLVNFILDFLINVIARNVTRLMPDV